MRFSVAAILGLAAFVAAQSSTITVTSSSSEEPTSTTTSLSPEQTCLAACGSSDICCQAACVNVPCPNNVQVNATTECAAACPQGNGTFEETQQYASCQSSCISSHFFNTATGAAAASTGTASTTASGSFGETSGASGSGSASQTSSGSGSAASATQNAAPEIRFGAAGAGLLGLILAGLAL